VDEVEYLAHAGVRDGLVEPRRGPGNSSSWFCCAISLLASLVHLSWSCGRPCHYLEEQALPRTCGRAFGLAGAVCATLGVGALVLAVSDGEQIFGS
jgi:hypothetical protein